MDVGRHEEVWKNGKRIAFAIRETKVGLSSTALLPRLHLGTLYGGFGSPAYFFICKIGIIVPTHTWLLRG